MRPVAIVGAGPVGQTTALLLARWGIPSILLERRPRREPIGSRSICQQRDVLDIWSAIGVGEQIAAEGVTWETARTFHRGRELYSYAVAAADHATFPPFVNISQSRTEALLDARIAQEPLVELRWGADVTGLAPKSGGVDVTVNGEVLDAAFAVLCAGPRADALRADLGVGFPGESFPDRFLICDIRAHVPEWATERRFHFDPPWNPGRQVLVHACPDSTFRIDWQVAGDFDLDAETASGALDRRIRQVVGDRPYEVLWKTVYRFQSRAADRLQSGRVLLAGDSAHLYAPFGARGLNSGVADAENAAWKIAFVAKGWAGEALLESYHHERHAAARENLEITSATMAFLTPQTPADIAHRRDVLERAGDDPAARALVNSGRLAEPFWYADSPLTTANPARPFAGRPPRGATPPPGPGILVSDAPIHDPGLGPRRLRELARDGLTLLLAPSADPAAATQAAAEVAAPIRVLGLVALDPSGALIAALGARAGEVWLLRPDAHIAAVLERPSAAAILRALRKALSLP